MSSRRSASPGRREGPEIDPREQVVAEATVPHRTGQVAVRAGNQLKIARDLAVAPERQEALLLERSQQHRLLVEPELAHFVEKQQPVIRAEQEAGPVADGASERALDVAEEGRHGRIATDRRAIDLDERPLDEPAGLLQFVDAAREERLAGTGGAEEQHRRRRSNGHVVEALDDLIERRAARLDARLEQRALVQLIACKAHGDPIVLGEVEIDDAERARIAASRSWRRAGLKQAGRDVARFNQQEQTDLCDVGSCRDVHEVVLGLGVEPV